MDYDKARAFIYRNARPLDLARWNYLFENGSPNDVLKILAAYQNADGGFGHALEPDCWNPNSSPIQTWSATKIIKETRLNDKAHPLIQGILKYLDSGEAFDGHTWANVVPSNDDYPHAPWWTWKADSEPSYNPTASFIGFILKYAKKDKPFYALGCGLAKEAYAYFKANCPLDAMHTVACFVEMYGYLKETGLRDLIDLDEFGLLLHKQIKQIITYDTKIWNTDYICKPSLFIESKTNEFYLENQAIADYECTFIRNTQNYEGAWDITWSWPDYSEQWSISKNWWKVDLIIKNLQYLASIS